MNASIWNDTTIVVPFRLASSRFPNKALATYNGRSLLERTIVNAKSLSKRTILVTAPKEDLDAAMKKIDFDSYGIRIIPSSTLCRSATDRIVQIFSTAETKYFLSLPIDEPEIQPSEIARAVKDAMSFADADAITFYCDFYKKEDYISPLSAKIVTNAEGMVLYISRAIVPNKKNGSIDPSMLKKNVGAFLFKREFLYKLAQLKDHPTSLDKHEGLEQLRWLELGCKVRALKIEHIGFGIDVKEQLKMLKQRCAN